MPGWLERLKTEFFARRISKHELDEIHDAAVKAAIKDQEVAGLDVGGVQYRCGGVDRLIPDQASIDDRARQGSADVQHTGIARRSAVDIPHEVLVRVSPLQDGFVAADRAHHR